MSHADRSRILRTSSVTQNLERFSAARGAEILHAALSSQLFRAPNLKGDEVALAGLMRGYLEYLFNFVTSILRICWCH